MHTYRRGIMLTCIFFPSKNACIFDLVIYLCILSFWHPKRCSSQYKRFHADFGIFKVNSYCNICIYSTSGHGRENVSQRQQVSFFACSSDLQEYRQGLRHTARRRASRLQPRPAVLSIVLNSRLYSVIAFSAEFC